MRKKSSRPSKSFKNSRKDDRGSQREDRDESRSQRGGRDNKERKEIRNARSLSDVLGVSGKSNRYQRGPNRNEGRNDQGREPFDASRRGGGSGSSPEERPKSTKLQYIMSFQPPPGSSSETSSRPDPRAKPIPAEPNRGQARPAPIRRAETQEPSRSESRSERRPENRSDRRSERKHEKRQEPRQVAREVPRQRQYNDQANENAKDASDTISGMVKRHPDGFGFLIPDNATHPDVYISRQYMMGIMTNDRVEVRVFTPKSKRPMKGVPAEDRLAGEIVKVISHANKTVVGKYLPVDQKYGVIQDDNRGWGTDLRIAANDAMNAKENDIVAVEITQYPDDHHEFTGRVVQIIGDLENPLNDTLRVVYQAGIPTEFSKEALADARKFGAEVTAAEKKGREDLTSLDLITIDGATARDFDDAIYCEQNDDGFRLVVAIADVSHYVKPGTDLDEEAYERGTSTYFPNFVVPMLPEELSNELCSLKPKVDRLCFACEMQINFQGEVESYRFFEGVMHSKARVIYGEAQEVIDGNTPSRLKHVEQNIKHAADLAKILMAKRFREGSLDLEIPETQVVVDTSGETTDIIKGHRLFAHRLIEELMLVTNICTAKFFDDKQVPGIYRVHDEPDPDNIKALQRYLWNLAGTKSTMGGASQGLAKKLTQALQGVQNRPEAQVLNILTLRTMQQAHYSENNIGHFGLGFSFYSHFTSPIRRYPDLIAHRLIKSHLYQKYSSMALDEEQIATATTVLSAAEQRSTKAERKLISIKKARFVRNFVGQEFEGIISSVTKFGVFVLLRQYDVDGLVKVENLGNDRFEFDEDNLSLVGRRSGLQYTIGDELKVRVTGADPEQGKVDFELADAVAYKSSPGERVRNSERNKDRNTDSNRKKDRGRGAKKNGADETDRQKKKQRKERRNAKKRGKTEDDRGGVRKKRVSKRSRKN